MLQPSRPAPREPHSIPAALVLAGLLVAVSAAAQPSPNEPSPDEPRLDEILTLEQAIALAEESNRQLSAADARLEAAAAGVREARSFRLPEVSLQGGYQRTDNPVFVFSNLLGQEEFGPGNFAIDALNRPDPLDNWRTQLLVEQPLWTGGRLAKGEKAARQSREAAEFSRERTRQEISRQVANAYTTAVLARLQLEVARESLATAEANVELIRDLYEGGLVVESDLLLAQVRSSEVREMVIRAESGVEISRAALNLVMGRDLETMVVLPADLEPRDEIEADPAALLSRAREQRPDLAAALVQRDAAQTGVEAARAGRWPTVGLEAAFEANAADFFGADGDNTSLMVGFAVPLYNGARTRARIDKARAQAREAGESSAWLAESIGLEVRRAWHETRAARERLEQANTGAELARRSLEIVTDRYREGIVTLPELLDGEAALTTARMRQVAARRDVLLAQVELDLATGDL